MFAQELCGHIYVDPGENQQGNIQRESERAKASWKDGHVSFLTFDREKKQNNKKQVYNQMHSRMKHKRLVNAVKCDETVQRRQAS